MRILMLSAGLLVFNFFAVSSWAESNIQNRGLSGQGITVTGNLIDEPRRHEGMDGKYVSYSFLLAPSENKTFGDEYIMVTFHTIKWSKTVGSMTYHKGDRVTLSGKYLESRHKDAKVNLAGSMSVNDLSFREVVGK